MRRLTKIPVVCGLCSGGWLLMAFLLVAGVSYAGPDLDPILRGKVSSGSDAWKVIVRGNFAYVANDAEGLQIYSITNPASPVRVGGYVTEEPAVGLALGFVTSSNYAYVATGVGGVDIVNISNPSNPQFVGKISDGVVDLQANAVLINPAGTYLFIADDGFGLKIYSIANPTNTSDVFKVGEVMTSDTAYGLAFNLNAGAAGAGVYVADGNAGVTKVNTVDKANPFVPDGGTYTPDAGGTCYSVAADLNNVFMACGDAGIQIVNDAFTTFRGQYPTGGDAYSALLQSNVLYVGTAEGGIILLDVSSVSKPVRFGGYYTGFGNLAYDVALSGTNLFVAASGLQIVGTNRLANPSKFGSFFTNDCNVIASAVVSNYAFIGDATYGLLVVDLTKLASPNLGILPNTNLFSLNATPTSISVVSNYAFMAEGANGLEIVDISDVNNLRTANQIGMNGGFYGDFGISGNYIFCAAGNLGMTVSDISDPEFPFDVTNRVTGGFCGGIVVTNNLAFLADGSRGLTVINVADPIHPVIIGNASTGGSANDIALAGNYAFLADGGIGLSVLDIKNPAAPVRIAGLNIGETAYGITIDGNFAYLSDGLASLMVIDISNPLDPRRVGGNTAFDAPYDVTFYSNKVYVATGRQGLQILNLYQPPTVSNALSIITQPQSITVPHGQWAYFGVSVSGAQPFRYQWRKNGAAISGATNVIYSLAISSLDLSEEGNFDVVITNNFGSITSSVAVLKVVAGITNHGLTQTYDGLAKPITVTASPAYISISTKYNGLVDAPTNAGNYTVVSTSLDAVFKGSVTNTLTVAPAPSVITLSNLSQIYNGTGRVVTYSVFPTNLPVALTYNGSTNPPVNAGSYQVNASSQNPNYAGSTNSVLVVAKATANIIFSNLVQTYTGTGRAVNYSTIPPGIPVNITYNGSTNLPVNMGSYSVVGTVSNANYVGSTTNTMTIASPPVSISINSTGSVINLSFTGLTNLTYVLQMATNLAPPLAWQNVISNKPGGNGIWRYAETNLAQPRQYYRVVGP